MRIRVSRPRKEFG
jgi:hypothetical protein